MLAITNHYDISIGIFNVKPGGIPPPIQFPARFQYLYLLRIHMLPQYEVRIY